MLWSLFRTKNLRFLFLFSFVTGLSFTNHMHGV
jgi:hypothetical protein